MSYLATSTANTPYELSKAQTILKFSVTLYYVLLKFVFFITLDTIDIFTVILFLINLVPIEIYQITRIISCRFEFFKLLKIQVLATILAMILVALFIFINDQPEILDVNIRSAIERNLLALSVCMLVPLCIPTLLLSPIIGLFICLTFIR